jgi:hypothetical protein
MPRLHQRISQQGTETRVVQVLDLILQVPEESLHTINAQDGPNIFYRSQGGSKIFKKSMVFFSKYFSGQDVTQKIFGTRVDHMILKLFQGGIKILDMLQGNLKKFYMCQGGPSTLKASD